MIKFINRFVELRYAHLVCFALLAILWMPMAFLGFHPHHEGLMLATLNLTSEAIKTGNSLPFNQYGHFWVLPYLTMDLLPLGGFTFLAQRIVSIFMILVSAILVRQISLIFYSRKTSLALFCLFLSTYPYGQPSIIWPSVPAQLALLVLTYSIIKSSYSLDRLQIFLASIATVFLFGSRVQIGVLSLICTTVILILTRRYAFLSQYFFYVFLLFGFVTFVFQRLGLLDDVLFDSFVFPLTYLDPSQQNWTFPRTSLVLAVALVLLYFAITLMKQTESSMRLVLFTLFALSTGTIGIQALDQSLFLKIYARAFVAVFLVILVGVLLSLIRDLKLTGAEVLPRKILYLYTLVGGIQVFPLFDVWHAWYASAPLIIATPLVLKRTEFYSRLSTKFSSLLANLFVLAFVSIFGLQAVQSVSSEVKPFPLEEVRGLFLSTQQALDFEREFEFFTSSIPRNAKVLNVCGNADPFFLRNYYSTGNRFFVFWPGIEEELSLEESLDDVDYVTSCTSLEGVNKDGQRLLEREFTEIQTNDDVISWGIQWKIYKRNVG